MTPVPIRAATAEIREHVHTDRRPTGRCTFFTFSCFLPLLRLTLTLTPIFTSTFSQRMAVHQVEAVFKVTFVPHLLPHITGKAPKIGAGALNQGSWQGEGAFNSGQEMAGPTEAALTTVPSIRNEMVNENSETTAISTNCGGHVSWSGCSGCLDKAPNKPSRCLFNSLPYKMFSKGDVFKIKTVIN